MNPGENRGLPLQDAQARVNARINARIKSPPTKLAACTPRSKVCERSDRDINLPEAI